MPVIFPCAVTVMTHLSRLIKTEVLHAPKHHAVKMYRGLGSNELNNPNLSIKWR
jgi:hypothetical protein